MITGLHTIVLSRHADAVRTFLSDVLALPSVDVHESDEAGAELWLVCDDVERTVEELHMQGVHCGPIDDRGWGLTTEIVMPGGERIGLYAPKHAGPLRRTPNAV